MPGRTPPFSISYHDPSGPFALEAMVTAWVDEVLTLGAGTLHDADKGEFPLDGLELTLRRLGGRFEAVAVRNPGVLSEFQQEGLLDAVSSALLIVDGRVEPHH